MRPTVLIVDDHDDFRESAGALLRAAGFEIVGGVADGAAALDAVRSLKPDVVLLDIQLPDIDGLTVAARLAQRSDAPQVVLISTRNAAAYGARLTAAPARGFLSKRELSASALATLIA